MQSTLLQRVVTGFGLALGAVFGQAAVAQEVLPFPPAPSASKGEVPISAPLAFMANDCLDIGSDLGSSVSVDYYDQAPFAFNGKITTTTIKYPKK